MSGICGFAAVEQDAIPPEASARDMAAAMAPTAEDSVETTGFREGEFGIYRRASSFAGTARNDRGFHVAWEGEFLNPEILRASNGSERKGGVGGFLTDLYVRFGEGMYGRLLGDFSVAVWDSVERKLLAGCDRFRVRPLYYYADGNLVLFGSKIRGLFACGGVPREIDHGAVLDYLDLSVIPTPRTIFRGIRKLPPGHVLLWKQGLPEAKRYWDMRYDEDDSKSETAYAGEVRTLLDRSVESRLLLAGSGKGVGAFLSGGVDSSTVVGLMARHAGSRVHAFSIGFGEDRYNEMEYARTAARHFGVTHHEYYVTPADTADFILRHAREYDEPYGNSSAVPTYYCARMAQDAGVSAIFAGDGGDELFAGNERYANDRKFQIYDRIPAWLRKGLIDPVAKAGTGSGVSLLEKAGKYVRRSSIPCPERWFSYSPSRTIPIYEEMITDDFRERTASHRYLEPYRKVYGETNAGSPLNRFMYLDLKAAIADNDLPKVTRMSELAGIKVLFPFLCHSVAELSGRIPSGMKMEGSRLRSFFKKAYSDFLPEETLSKKKHGFGLPIPVWLGTDRNLRDLAADLVLSPRSLQRGYFRKKFLENLFASREKDTTSFYGTILWDLMMLELWHRSYRDR